MAPGRLTTCNNPVIYTSNLVRLVIQLNAPSTIAIKDGIEENIRKDKSDVLVKICSHPSSTVKSLEYSAEIMIDTNDRRRTISTPKDSTKNPDIPTINAPASLSLKFHLEKSI